MLSLRISKQTAVPASFQSGIRLMMVALMGLLVTAFSGCGSISETLNRGYIRDPAAIAQIKVGDLKGEVEILLGSPQTTGIFGSHLVYYYVTQIQTKVSFLPPETVDQKVLAIFFNEDDKVTRIADFGTKDGIVVDFAQDETPVAGEDLGIAEQFFYRILNTSKASTPGG